MYHCVFVCTGDGAGVGKGRTIAGLYTTSPVYHKHNVSLPLSRYYLSELLRRKEESNLVSSSAVLRHSLLNFFAISIG